MNIQEVVSLILASAVFVISVCIVFISYFLIKALKSITLLSDSLQNTTEDIREKIQNNILRLVPALVIGLIGKLIKRGR